MAKGDAQATIENDTQTFDDPGASDVHIDSAGDSGSPPKRSPALKRFMQSLRSHVKAHGLVRETDLETYYKSAIGHAGGTAKSRSMAADGDPGGSAWDIVDAPCKAAGHGGASGCSCPSCAEGDPADCLCSELMDEDDATGATSTSEASPIRSSSKDAFSLFMPMQFNDTVPEWIHYRPKPATYIHPRYGDLAITRESNEEMVGNFNSGIYQPMIPIDAEHQTKLSGALAFVKEMRLANDGSIEARLDWTPRGKGLVTVPKAASEQFDEPQFKYFSPEWYDEWTSPDGQTFKNVAIGGALTNRPYFKAKDLRPLVASEGGIQVFDEDEIAVAPVGAQPRKDTTGETHMTEEEKTTEDQPDANALAEELAALKAENAELKKASETDEAETARQFAEQQVKSLTEQVAAMQADSRRRQFAEVANDFEGDGNYHVSLMEKLSDEDREAYITHERALAEQLKSANLFQSLGVSGAPADESPTGRLESRTRALMEKDSISYADALAKVAAEDPSLWADHRKSVQANG